MTWAERVNQERGREQEFEEILGYHLEQAYRYRTELGPLDAEGTGDRASAPRRSSRTPAGARSPVATSRPACRCSPGAAVLPTDVAGTARASCSTSARSLIEHGRLRGGDAADRRKGRALAERARRRAAAWPGWPSTSSCSTCTRRPELEPSQIERAKEIIADPRALRATTSRWPAPWNEVVRPRGRPGQYEAAAEAADRVVEHAKRAGDRAAGRAGGARGRVPHGPRRDARSPRASAAATRLLDSVRATARPRRSSSARLAQLKAMDGQFDEARRCAARVRGDPGRAPGRGSTPTRPRSRPHGSRCSPGDLVAAEALLRRDDDGARGARRAVLPLDDRGHPRQRARAAGRARGRGRATRRSPRASPTRTTSRSQISWRTARAKVLAHAGDSLDEAVALAEQAVDLADERRGRRDARRRPHGARAGATRSLGRRESSGPPWREALELYELKA